MSSPVITIHGIDHNLVELGDGTHTIVPLDNRNVFKVLGIDDIIDFLAPLGFLPEELKTIDCSSGLPITKSLSTLYRIINLLIEYDVRKGGAQKSQRRERNSDMDTLVRQYIEMTNEEYEHAKQIINRREKVKEAIKKELKRINLHSYRLRSEDLDAIVSFEVRQYQKVDVDAIPEDIKNRYIKYQEIWRETPPVILRRS